MIGQSWNTIATAANPADAVRAHLETLLAETDDDRAVLDRLMSRFTTVEVDDHGAIVSFRYVEYDEVVPVRFSLPGEMTEPIRSLQAIVTKHGGIAASCLGGGDIAFPGANSVEDFLANGDAFPDTPMIVFDVGQNIMVGHPTEQNARGEPTLYFIDHEDGQAVELEGAAQLTAAQVYLRLLTQHLGGEAYFEAVGG